jgi:predicted ATPase
VKSGLLLRSLAIPAAARSGEGFPFSVPAIRALEQLAFRSPVTFLVGENGSGKSTLLEALALAAESIAVGSEALDRDPSLAPVLPLARALRLTWSRRTRRGLFLRAEDFFGFVKRVNRERAQLVREAARLRRENPELPEGELTRITGPYTGSAAALAGRYGEDADARSHGEQFLALFQARLAPEGLYLLDEPEMPLSPSRQLALLSLLREASSGPRSSQFVIATHSPILLALPGAAILSFDEVPIREVPYDELEHVRLTRDFLNRPQSYLRHL